MGISFTLAPFLVIVPRIVGLLSMEEKIMIDGERIFLTGIDDLVG